MTRDRAAGWSLAAVITALSAVAFHAVWTFALHMLASAASLF